MPPLHLILHAALGVLGVAANSLLIAAIIYSRRNIFLKTYSIILLNTAVNDFITCIADAMSMIRIVVYGDGILYIYQGPCTEITDSICYFGYSIIIHLAIDSIILIALSFWYRLMAVSSRALPSALQLQTLCLLALAPTLFMIVQFQWAASSREEVIPMLSAIHPEMNPANLRIGGNVDTSEPHSFATTSYVVCFSFLVYFVIIRFRRQVESKLSEITTMSDRTKSMHQTLVKALTIHALLPMSLCAGIGSWLLLAAGVPRYELLESFPTIGVTVPSVANPIITMYFVGPLRNFVLLIWTYRKSRKVGADGASKDNTTNVTQRH